MNETDAPEEKEKPEILIVDDDLDQLELIRSILAGEGYQLRLANSGEIALSSARARRPDLILLDVQMPGLDGYEVCRKLKQLPPIESVPVVFLSALDGTKDKVRGFEAGGMDYITKPYQAIEVVERIKTHLRVFFLRQKLESEKIRLENLVSSQGEKKSAYTGMGFLQTVFLSLGDGMICTDMKGEIILINEIAKNLTGWYGENAYGAHFDDVCRLIDFHTQERIESPLRSVLGTGEVYHLSRRVCLLSKDGIERYISDSIAPIKEGDGRTIGCVMVFRDNADDKVRKKELERLIYDDLLTDIRNRLYFDEELIRINKENYHPLGILIADINGLKITNDAFGHAAGDRLLVKTAHLLRDNSTANDIVCRYGGDEFVVLIPRASQEGIEQFIATILNKVGESRQENELLSISFGFAIKESMGENILITLKTAEDRLYRNKLMEDPSVRHTAIQTILNTLYEKSPREEAHSARVSKLSELLGTETHRSLQEINELKTAGFLHDIGKTIVKDEVLNKPGALDDAERDEMQRHPEIGYRILRNTHELSELSIAILQHHERWDGTGYPRRISGGDISLYARMIAIADSFDAMTSDRPYKAKLSSQEALRVIAENAGRQFDPELAASFIQMMENQSQV